MVHNTHDKPLKREIKERIKNRAYRKYLVRKHWGITVGDSISDYKEAEKEILGELKKENDKR